MTFFFFAAGVLLLLLLTWDVHLTVFVQHGPAGPLASRLYRLCWRVWHGLIGDSSPKARRRLAGLGSVLIPMTVVLWGGMLLLGFMLLLLPYASIFQIGGHVAFPAWFNALYISSYSISTLGIGDVIPNGEVARLIMVTAAASGFVLITVAVTYLLSVYGALERMTALAFEIHRFIGRTSGGTPGDVLALTVVTQSTAELTSWLASSTTALSQVVQSDDEFPLLHFFHMPNERSLTLALIDLLEVVTLCRTLLSPREFPALAGGLVTAGTERVVRGYFVGLGHKFPGELPEIAAEELGRQRRESFEEAWETLSEAGVALRPQAEAWQQYEQARAVWDKAAAQLRAYFGYPAPGARRHIGAFG